MIYRVLFILCLLSSLPTPSMSANQESLIDEIIVTANRENQPWLTASQSVTVLDDASISSTGATHINELTTRVAGSWISRGNGQEHLTAIRSPVLTGAGGCGAFLMLQDNIPLRASGFCNVNELFEAASEVASSLEVLKGPGSAAHGSNALHGIIHVRTPMPGAESQRSQIEAGPHDYWRIKHITTSERSVIALSGTSDGGYKDDSGFGQQKAVMKRLTQFAGGRLIYQLAITNLNQETSGFIQGDDVYKDPAMKRLNPNPEAFRDARSAKLSADYLSDSRDLRLTPYVRWTDMRFLQHFLPGQPLEENGHTSLGLQSRWGLSDQMTVGLDLERTNGFLKQTQFNDTIGSPFLVGTLPKGKQYDYEASATVAAAFGQYQLPLSARLDLTMGLRAEHVAYDYDNRMIAGRTRDDGTPCGFGGCRYSRPEDRRDSFTNVSPKLTLNLDLGDHHFFAGLTQGFRAPQATELYRLQGGQSVVDIDSESLTSLELGLRGQTEAARYQVAVYAQKKSDFIFKDTDRANVDNGRTRHHGLEVEASFDVSDRINVELNWTVARHRYDNNPALASTPIKGNDIDTAPRTFGGLRLNWMPTERLRGELEWTQLGRYYTNPENTNSYDGHNLLHLRGALALNNQWQLFFRVTNLNDTDYAERADFAFGNERFFVGEPRSVYFGVRRSQ